MENFLSFILSFPLFRLILTLLYLSFLIASLSYFNDENLDILYDVYGLLLLFFCDKDVNIIDIILEKIFKAKDFILLYVKYIYFYFCLIIWLYLIK
jgi:hypothetical protein